jgi:hypothetical protein
MLSLCSPDGAGTTCRTGRRASAVAESPHAQARALPLPLPRSTYGQVDSHSAQDLPFGVSALQLRRLQQQGRPRSDTYGRRARSHLARSPAPHRYRLSSPPCCISCTERGGPVGTGCGRPALLQQKGIIDVLADRFALPSDYSQRRRSGSWLCDAGFRLNVRPADNFRWSELSAFACLHACPGRLAHTCRGSTRGPGDGHGRRTSTHLARDADVPRNLCRDDISLHNSQS